jgi:hypothetical protein
MSGAGGRVHDRRTPYEESTMTRSRPLRHRGNRPAYYLGRSADRWMAAFAPARNRRR